MAFLYILNLPPNIKALEQLEIGIISFVCGHFGVINFTYRVMLVLTVLLLGQCCCWWQVLCLAGKGGQAWPQVRGVAAKRNPTFSPGPRCWAADNINNKTRVNGAHDGPSPAHSLIHPMPKNCGKPWEQKWKTWNKKKNSYRKYRFFFSSRNLAIFTNNSYISKI